MRRWPDGQQSGASLLREFDQPEVARLFGDGDDRLVLGDGEGVVYLGFGKLGPGLRGACGIARAVHRHPPDAVIVLNEIKELAVGRPDGLALVGSIGSEAARPAAI